MRFVCTLGPNSPYPWDYWPHEDGRSECGYVGLTNLGATCYMASCMQHLYMMPQARASILAANTEHSKHEPTLKELQRMFAYLLVSVFNFFRSKKSLVDEPLKHCACSVQQFLSTVRLYFLVVVYFL